MEEALGLVAFWAAVWTVVALIVCTAWGIWRWYEKRREAEFKRDFDRHLRG